MDVSNISYKTLTIRKSGFNEVLVEGFVNNENEALSPQKISKTFVINEDIEEDQINDISMSEDGVLVIQVKKVRP